MAETLFISDLHLSPERPEKLELFKRFMRGPARRCRALYILGDLVEQFWVGNDDITPPNREIIGELSDFTANGNRLYFIRGNRELMLDKSFEALTGCTVLPDRSVIDLYGKKVLLMHGDRLCSRDKSYQLYRRFMEFRPVKKLFLNLPYRLRTGLAHGLRPVMKKTSARKGPDIIDADPATVASTMKAFAVSELIHGHTHRPGIHEFELAGNKARRIVLGDWYDQDSVLVCENGGRRLLSVGACLDSN